MTPCAPYLCPLSVTLAYTYLHIHAYDYRRQTVSRETVEGKSGSLVDCCPRNKDPASSDGGFFICAHFCAYFALK